MTSSIPKDTRYALYFFYREAKSPAAQESMLRMERELLPLQSKQGTLLRSYELAATFTLYYDE